MNKLHLSAMAAALALTATAAQAASISPAELKVTGVLDVPACTVNAEDKGVYDYGDLPVTSVKPGAATTQLGEKKKRWTITCDGNTYLSFSVTDNADGTESSVDAHRFGLGTVNGTGKLGYFVVMLANAEVDGVAAHVYSSSRSEASDNKNTTALVRKKGFSMGWAETGSSVKKLGKVFEADMLVNTWLAGSQVMNGPITDDVKLAGSLTLDFAFGL